LHASGLVERRLDQAHFLRELLMADTPADASLFAGVGRLAPGSWLRLSPGRREGGRHWRLDPAVAGKRRCDPVEAAEEMAALVEAAVRRRLPETGPVAAHLSGGLDSGAIAVLAGRALRGAGRPLLAYPFLPGSYGDYRPEGEEPQVRLVLEREPDLACVPIRLGPTRGAEMPRSGWGGDQAASYNGRAALAEALLHGRLGRVAAEARALAAARGASPLRTLWGEVAPHLVPVPIWRAIGRRTGRPPGVADVTRGLLRAEALAGLQIERVRIGPDDVANRLRLVEDGLVARRAEHWALTAARTGMAVSFPLLDRAVVAYAVALPSAMFLRGGVRRRLFRDATQGVLPDGVRLHRGKRRPFPELHLLIGLERAALLDFVAEARAHPLIDRLIDLGAVAALLRTVPAGEEARRRAAELERDGALLAACVALLRVLRAVCHLRQHH